MKPGFIGEHQAEVEPEGPGQEAREGGSVGGKKALLAEASLITTGGATMSLRTLRSLTPTTEKMRAR